MGQFLKFSKNTFFTQILNLIVVGGTTIFIARVLGPKGQGEAALLLFIPNIALVFGQIGMMYATNYFAGKVSDEKNSLNGLTLSIFLGLLTMLVSVIAVSTLHKVFFKGVSYKLLFIMSLSVPVFFVLTELTAIMQSRYKINERNTIALAQPVFFLFLIFIFIGYFKMGVVGMVLAWFFSLVCAILLAFYLVLKGVRLKMEDFDIGLIKDMCFFGAKAHFGNIFKQLTYRGDYLLLNYFSNETAVGFYSIAVKIAEIIWKIPDAIGTVLLSRNAKSNSVEAAGFTSMICRMLLIPLIIISALLIFFAKNIIIFVFGPAYIQSYFPLVLLLPGIIVFAIWKILTADLIAHGHAIKYSISSIVGCVSMLALDIFLIPLYGINGASIGSTLSYLAATIVVVVMYTKHNNVSVRSMLIPTRPDIQKFRNAYKQLWS